MYLAEVLLKGPSIHAFILKIVLPVAGKDRHPAPQDKTATQSPVGQEVSGLITATVGHQALGPPATILIIGAITLSKDCPKASLPTVISQVAIFVILAAREAVKTASSIAFMFLSLKTSLIISVRQSQKS